MLINELTDARGAYYGASSRVPNKFYALPNPTVVQTPADDVRLLTAIIDR